MHPGLWITLGLVAFAAYAYSHRNAIAQAKVRLEGQEAGVPLQPFVQPQPPRSALNWQAYGLVPFGQDAQTTSRPNFKVSYATPYGALV